MTTKYLPSAHFRLVLLFVVAAVTCIQPESTISSSNGAYIPQQDMPTSVNLNTSNLVSFHEDRGLLSNLKEKEMPLLAGKVKSDPQNGTAAVFTTSVKLRLAWNKANAVNELYQQCEVGSVMKNLFGSPQYQKWSGIILSAYPERPLWARQLILSQLTTHYKGDLIQELSEAKRGNTWRNIGEQLERLLIDSWIIESKGELVDLVRIPLLQQWYKRAMENKEEPAVELSFRLQKLLGIKDQPRPGVFNDDEAARSIASDMAHVTPYQVEFNRLNLHKVVSIDALLTSTDFRKWVGFVNANTQENLGNVLLVTLRKLTLWDHEYVDELFATDLFIALCRFAVVDALIDEWTDLNYGIADVLSQLHLYVYDRHTLNNRRWEIFDAYLRKQQITDQIAVELVAVLIRNGKPNMTDLPPHPWLKKWYNARKTAKSAASPHSVPDSLLEHNAGDELASMLRSAESKEGIALEKLKGTTGKELLVDPFLTALYRSSKDEIDFGKTLVKKLQARMDNVGVLTACYESDKASWLAPIVEETLLNEWKENHEDEISLFWDIVWEKKDNEAYTKHSVYLWMKYVKLIA